MGAYYGLGLGLGGAPVPIRGSHLAVGELIEQFPGAAAAYSLRPLRNNASNVVRVRRESDNAERDFTAQDITSGEMVNWVNRQLVPPLDIGIEAPDGSGRPSVPDGGTSIGTPAAAYSLRSLGTTQADDIIPSGDTVTPSAGAYVVQVRRSSDDNVKSFTASEVSDGTLEDWVGSGNDGHVRTWYDQSTNDNHATQTTPTNQPKIVDGGNLLKDSNNKPEIDFDGTDDYFDLTSSIGFQGGGGCVISLQDPQSGVSTATLGSSSSNRLISFSDALARWYFTTNAIDVDSSTTVSGLTLFTINHDGTTNDPNVKAFRDGSLMVATTPDSHQGEANTSTVANQIGARRDLTYFSGVLKEIIIYDTDQSANRTAIEANIGEHYSITGIPAYDDTVNGFVETWYDQSGNGNDATQLVAANQPKIVNGGVLESDGIHFDGSDDVLTASGTYARSGADLPLSMLSVFKQDVEGVQYVNSISRGAAGNPFNRQLTRTTSFDYGRRDDSGAAKAGQGLDPAINTKYLFSTFDSGTTASGFVNGSSAFSNVDVDLGTQTINQIDIGAFNSSTIQFPFNGKIQEFILYNSDQSANRSGIETNINNHYNIYS